MPFPTAWWEVSEVTFALMSFEAGDYKAILKGYRADMCPRTGPRNAKKLKAKEFDNAVSGAQSAMAGHQESVASILKRARWMIDSKIPPVFARPVKWNYSPEELEVIAEARKAGLEPVFLGYDARGIDKVPGPNTDDVEVNPWAKWMA